MTFSSCFRYPLVSLIAFIFVLASPNAASTNYYIDATGGSDANGGTSPVNAWKTIDKVNDASFLSGDQVLFKRGEVWRETLLVPDSGDAIARISFADYGEEADSRPLISCTDDISNTLWDGVIPNGGFEQAAVDPMGVLSFPGWKGAGGLLAQAPGNGSDNSARMTLTSGSQSLQTAEWHMEANVPYVISGAVRATVPGTTIKVFLYTLNAPRQYLDPNGDWQLSLPNWSHFFTTSSTSWQTFSIPSSTEIAGSRTIFRVDITGAGAEALVDNLKITKVGSDFWSVPIDAAGTKILIENDTRLAGTTAEWDESYRWHSSGTTKSVRYLPPIGTTPDQHVVELAARRIGIGLFNKSYINIENIIVEGCEGPLSSPETQGAGILIVDGSSNNTVNNVLAVNNDQGIRVQGVGPVGELNANNVFSNIEVANGVSMGIALRSYATGNIIRNCLIHDHTQLPGDGAIGDKEAISIGGNTGNGPGNIIEDCEIYNIGISSLNVFNSPQTIVRNNYIRDVGRIGIGSGVNNKSSQGWNLDGLEIYGNLIVRTGTDPDVAVGQGISVSASDFGDITGVKIYNNTIIDCELYDSKDGGISLRGVANPSGGGVNLITDIEVKNNIVSGCFGGVPHALYIGSIAIVDIQNLVLNNNLFFPDSSVPLDKPFISYKGTDYKLGEFQLYQQTTGQDSNSLMLDPQFINSATDDYHLQSMSLGIDTGNPLDAYSNEPENNGDRINMGAYGNTAEAAIGDDADLDGLTDQNERCYDGDCSDYDPYHSVTAPFGTDLDATSFDTDGDGFSDVDEVVAGSNPLDISSVPLLGDINNDGVVNIADVLLATRIVLGIYTPTAGEAVRADTAPLSAGEPAPDGEIDLGDVSVIVRLATGQLSF